MKKIVRTTRMGCLAGLLLLLAATTDVVGEAVARHEATVAPFATAPTVDGSLAPGEWDVAFRTIGFQSIKSPHVVDPRTGQAWFGYTPERLYVAVASDLPPDSALIATDLARTGEFHKDDAIEIWLDPNRAVRDHAEGSRYLYQLVVNSVGVTLNRRVLPPESTGHVEPPGSQPAAEWRGNWKFAQNVDAKAGLWVFEASLPWADLGWKPSEVLGRPIGVLIARNYQRPAAQRAWFGLRETFSNALDYPRLVLRDDVPCARIAALGESLLKGHLQFKARIINPTEAGTVTVWSRVSGRGHPPIHARRDLQLPAHGELAYELDVGADRLGEKGPYEVKLMVRREAGDITVLNWSLGWEPTANSGWAVEGGQTP